MYNRGFPTSPKFTEGVFRVASGLLQLKEPPGIVHQVLFMLRVHSVHLPVFTALVEQWAQEELSEPADIQQGQSAFVYGITHLEFQIPSLYSAS